ncbi:hypothetical protein NPX13_g6669 [Xylaria arbuscula]|uniref:Uncharacterized protein n=1 Tax=Xylaria arbuscula TaxID=114810 RepID=A0A9W8NBS3_9PEZI|nr:hypothetical protein NPX13_g6669 [Xylaria arbuscula]
MAHVEGGFLALHEGRWNVTKHFFSFGIDGFELLFCFLWQRNPGIRPGWFIGAELILLGGNIVALVFLSAGLPTQWDIESDFSYGPIRSIKIAIISFVAIFTLVRFILFVFACIETHTQHTAKQVQMIVAALRQQNMNDPTTAGLVNNAMYPDQQQQHIPPYGYPQMPRPSHEPYPNTVYYRELPENQKFQGDIRQQLYAT